MKYLNYLTAVLLALVISAQVNANCVRVNPVDQGCDACGASLNLGNIGLMNVNYQPVGTVLARSVFRLVPAIRNSDPERVLYQCDLADKDSIYEVFATNGDSNVGGAWDMGDYHFQTYFPFTALKLVHMRSGKPFTRIWQQVPLTEYEVSGNKILIKGKHFSPISAELIRTGTNERKAAYASWGCPAAAADNYTGPYNCNQPNGYVVFKGPGMDVPEAGKDSYNHFDTWFTGRYMAFGMNTSPVATMTQNLSQGCRVDSYTSNVSFPAISPAALSQGQSVSAPLSVTLECSSGASVISGVDNGQISLGFQASYPAWLQAQQLGLTSSDGTSDYLVSDHYNMDTTLAKGVGIQLNTELGNKVSFLGWHDLSNSSIGWRPVLEDAHQINSNDKASRMYQRNFTARLTKLPGKGISAGRIDATAYLLVRLQ
ncbi:TPA: fimbrial protein [Escherichia coli]|nr:fimbrial protein [Escherichia coli]